MVVATGNMKAYQWHHGTDKLYSILKIWNWKFESDSHVGLVEDTKKQRKGLFGLNLFLLKLKIETENTIAK